jgi:hypothetical protein
VLSLKVALLISIWEPMKTAPARGESWGRQFIGCYGGIRIRPYLAKLPLRHSFQAD